MTTEYSKSKLKSREIPLFCDLLRLWYAAHGVQVIHLPEARVVLQKLSIGRRAICSQARRILGLLEELSNAPKFSAYTSSLLKQIEAEFDNMDSMLENLPDLSRGLS